MAEVVQRSSSFSPQGNSAPDLLVIETSFQRGGRAVAVSDLVLRVFSDGVQILPDITASTEPAIERKVSGCGTYYFVRLNPDGLGESPLEARWYATYDGKPWCPSPQITMVATQSTMDGVLLSSELRDWILRKLGWPKQGVELDESQICDSIADALAEYNQYVPRWKYGEIRLVTGRKAYTITEFGRGVYDVQFRRKEGTPIISDPLFGRHYPRFSQLAFDDFVLSQSHYGTVLRVTGQEPIWRWDPGTPTKIFIDTGEWDRSFYEVTYAYGVDHRLGDITPAHQQTLKRLALARAKIVLGEIREKFGDSVITPGGNVQLNGGKLKDEGFREAEALQEILQGLAIPMWPIYG